VTPTSTLDTRSHATLDITVVLCTYNRCEDLAGALESIAASQVANSVTWEVLVVDNNSTDHTRDVVEAFSSQHPGRFRYLFEPKAGKSHALNTGIANARGNVLAFVDDDVNVEPTWLQNLTADLLHEGEWAGVGGRTLPAGEFTPPPWLPDNFNGIVFACFDLGNKAAELDQAPYGANMAFRKSVFERHGGFRVDLGPTPNSQIRNEDTELGRRLLAAGERLRYEPSAVVYHPVPQGRIRQEYFFPWWFDFGRAVIRERGDRPDVCGVPWDYLSLVRHVAEMPIRTLKWLFSIDPQKRFRYKCWVWKGAGQIAELYRRSVGRTKAPGVL
jgi:glucosyl-dolichyl phosphate glucuronosyltransferase